MCRMCARRCKCAGGTAQSLDAAVLGASVQLLPRPPLRRRPLSSQWIRRCRHAERTQVSSDTLHREGDTAGDTVGRNRMWNTEKQGHNETQPNNRAGRVVQLIGAEWSGRLGSCRVTWAAPNPASVARGPGDAPSPPSDPRKHHHPPSCLDLRIDPPLWDVLPVRPKFCLLSEDR